MSLPAKRISSEGDLGINPKLSESRRAKLMNIKQREALKDQLTEKFQNRFGQGAADRGADEVSVTSAAIRQEVDKFAQTAGATEANVDRLERRLQHRAQGRVSDDRSVVTGVSAYSGITGLSQRSRSCTSLAGKSVVSLGSSTGYDWNKLDEYASYLHEQDSFRQQLGVVALQRKMKMDLDQQVKEKQRKKLESLEEDKRYHQNSLMELERWKDQEKLRAEEKESKVQREKKDRSEQLAYEKQLKVQEEQKKVAEESMLVEKIVVEMEADQKRFAKKKEQTKKAMKKVFEENMKDQDKRNHEKQLSVSKEATQMKEYNRVLDEQDEQKAEELAERMARQSQLMKKMQAGMEAKKADAGSGDEKRASAQQEEMDRHFFEAEAVKESRLRQMRLENQAYLIKQMDEKGGRNGEDQYLTGIQSQIMERDTQEYNGVEKQKVIDRRLRNIEHSKEVTKQIQFKTEQSVPAMSKAEISMNKPLLKLVNRTLKARDANWNSSGGGYGEEE